MATKSVGATTAMAFALECMRRGALVSEAFGDNAPYDFIVDVQGVLYRVQVKGSSCNKNGTFQANTQRRTLVPKPEGRGFVCKAAAYKKGQIDFIAAEFFGHWCIWGQPHLLPATIGFNPLKATVGKKWAQGHEAWHLLGF